MAGARREKLTRAEHAASGAHTASNAFEAEVVDAPDGGLAQVRRIDGPSALVACRVAVPGYRPGCGDRVVVLDIGGGAKGTAPVAIVGVLASAPIARVIAASGAVAELEGGALVLRDPSGALVASYDPEGSTLRIGEGLARVEIGSPEGKVVVAARDIELAASVRAAVSAPELQVTAQRASLHAEEASLAAATVRTVAEEIAHTAGRWETRVGRLIERAAEAYREAELAETRADRIRTLAKATFDVVAGRTSIMSEDDTIVDGKRVLLG